MEGIRILTDFSEKQKTRALYEAAFDDPPAFVDYYYREKCADNTMIVLEENGQVLSMLHLNPYFLRVNHTQTKTYYIVAVATDQAHRRKGYMARVLEKAFAEMAREYVPFCFLLPVDEAIYTPFRFETVCDFITRDNPLSGLSYEEIEKQYQVYCVQDALYRRRRAEEDALAAQDIAEVLPEHPVIMARIVCGDAYEALFGKDAGLSALRKIKCYFREEV